MPSRVRFLINPFLILTMNKARYTNKIPEDRGEVIKVIEEVKKPVKVMILGGVDSGKTTLAVFLTNELLKNGFKVGVIDSDVGQKEYFLRVS